MINSGRTGAESSPPLDKYSREAQYCSCDQNDGDYDPFDTYRLGPWPNSEYESSTEGVANNRDANQCITNNLS